MAIPAHNLHAKFSGSTAVIEPPITRIPAYTIALVRTMDQFIALALEWRQLLDACGETSISLNHTWLLRWLETFPAQDLLTVAIRDEAGQLIAVAPFLISRNPSGLFCRLLRRVQFIGTSPEVYDWMKIVIHPEADPNLVLKLVAHELIQRRSLWDVLDLRFMHSESQLNILNQQLQPFLKSIQISQPMSIPFIELPENLDDYPVQFRKRKYQSDLNRINNHLRKDFSDPTPRLRVHQPGLESDQLLENFLKRHQDYWLERGCHTEYDRHPKLLGFYQRIHREFGQDTSASKAVFEFSTLEIGGNPVSYHFDIQARQGCMGYLSSYDPQAKKYRPGILHIEALIERTHQLGGRRFDFGRGDEHYKNQWHIDKKPLWSLLAFRNQLSHTLWELDARLKKTFRNGTITHGTTDHPA